jgi:hypothetical protein
MSDKADIKWEEDGTVCVNGVRINITKNPEKYGVKNFCEDILSLIGIFSSFLLLIFVVFKVCSKTDFSGSVYTVTVGKNDRVIVKHK